MSSNEKLTLPAFLKVLTNGNMSMPKAMALASKVYKTCNTPSVLGNLTDARLKTLGVESKEDRKAALAAFKKAGYKPSAAVKPRAVGGSLVETSSAGAGPSIISAGKKQGLAPRKRKRDADLEEMLPTGPQDEAAKLGSFEFNEVLDEEVLRTKLAVVNRAPVMSVWATIVAERLGFKREEALSIASAYTEMNAISKGVSLGIFEESKGKGIKIGQGQSQPYVDLMGRRPLYETQSGEWRALVKGEPIEPASAFTYVSRAFRQTLPFVAGAMRVLAASFPPAELNEKGFGLYASFRPEVGGWGQRAEVRCAEILSLRKIRPKEEDGVRSAKAEEEDGGRALPVETGEKDSEKVKDEDTREPLQKKAKSMTVEEYEAILDASTEFDDLIYNGDF